MAGEANFIRFRANLTELQAAWQDRIEDANALIAANRPASAIAMMLYALEIHLKTLICRRLDLDQLPVAFEIHQLDGLLILTGLDKRLRRVRKVQVQDHWAELLTASRQINDLRYKPNNGWNLVDATRLMVCLTDPQDGIIPWLSKRR